MNLLREGTCVLEAWIPYEKLSVLISGNGRGEFATFPVVETIKKSVSYMKRLRQPELMKKLVASCNELLR